MTDLDLDALEAIARSATPGPWRDSPNGIVVAGKPRFARRVVLTTSEVDAVYSAAFDPSTVLALIKELREAQSAIVRVRDLHYDDLFRGHLSNGCKACGEGWPCATVRTLYGDNQPSWTVFTYNDDKPHRCPSCHAVTDPERRAQQNIVQCCSCGSLFTWDISRVSVGVVCPEDHND